MRKSKEAGRAQQDKKNAAVDEVGRHPIYTAVEYAKGPWQTDMTTIYGRMTTHTRLQISYGQLIGCPHSRLNERLHGRLKRPAHSRL